MYFRQFCYYHLLVHGKDIALHLNKRKSPSTKVVPSSDEIDPVVLKKKMQMWKVYGQVIWKSLLERSVKVSIKTNHEFR